MFLIFIISYFPIIGSDIIKIRELNIAIWRHQDPITLEIQGVILWFPSSIPENSPGNFKKKVSVFNFYLCVCSRMFAAWQWRRWCQIGTWIFRKLWVAWDGFWGHSTGTLQSSVFLPAEQSLSHRSFKYLKLNFLLLFVFLWVWPAPSGVCLEVEGQLSGVSFLLPSWGFLEPNSYCLTVGVSIHWAMLPARNSNFQEVWRSLSERIKKQYWLKQKRASHRMTGTTRFHLFKDKVTKWNHKPSVDSYMYKNSKNKWKDRQQNNNSGCFRGTKGTLKFKYLMCN